MSSIISDLQQKINTALANDAYFQQRLSLSSPDILARFEAGQTFETVKAYVQSNIRGDAPGENLTVFGQEAFQRKNQIVSSIINEDEGLAINKTANAPNLLSLGIPALIIGGGILWLLTRR